MSDNNRNDSHKPYDLAQFAAAHAQKSRPERTGSGRSGPARTEATRPLAGEGGFPPQSGHPFANTGEIPVFDDEPVLAYETYESYDTYDAYETEDTGYDDPGYGGEDDSGDDSYQSVYVPDDSGIVRESRPDGALPKPAPHPRKKRPDPRLLLERRLSLSLCGVLALGLAAGTLLLTFLPRSTQSQIEKRELAKLPAFSLESWFSGEFTAGVATYYTDTVPNRDSLKRLGSQFKALFGLPGSESDVEFVGNIQKVDKPKPAENTPAPAGEGASQPEGGSAPIVGQVATGLEGTAGRNMPAATPTPAPVDFGQAEEADMVGEGQIMLVKQDGHYRGLEPFGGTADMAQRYSAALNDLHSQLGDGVKIYSMPAPLACEFYTPDKLKEYVRSQSECFDGANAQLNEGIVGLNVCGVLAQHAGEAIYCRTDHHWQPLGAYYAAQAFAQAAGVSFDDISTYTPGKFEGFVGSMYGFSGQSAKILNDSEEFTYYTPSKPYDAVYYDTAFNFQWDEDNLFAEGVDGTSDAYSYFLGGDQYIVKVTTQNTTGRTLLVMKDSYGNATIPYYVGSFDKIFVADIRYMERNLVSFIRDMGITDVVFTVSAFSLVGENGANIANLISQNAGETVTDPHP